MDNKHQKEHIKSYTAVYERTRTLMKTYLKRKTPFSIINNSYAVIYVNSKDIKDPKNPHINGINKALIEELMKELEEEKQN